MKKPPSLLKTSFWTAFLGLLLISFFWIGYTITSHKLPQSGEPAVIYSTHVRDDLQRTFSHAIRQSEDSILLIIYSLRDKMIINTLRKMSEQGIDIQIICDAQASRGVARKLGPRVKTYYRKGKGIMHQKILAIDEKKVWIGSANMTTTSLKGHGNLVTGLDSPELVAMIRKKAEAMTKVGQIHPVPAEEFLVGGQKSEMWFLPDNTEAVQKIKQLIRSAEKTINVAMFTWTRHDFAQEIAEARKRGVDTQVVIDGSSGSGVSKRIVEHLWKEKVPVRLSQGQDLLHHKFLIVDNKILVNGSANWTLSAFNKNDDCFLILHDLNDDQRRHLKKLWQEIMAESEEVVTLEN